MPLAAVADAREGHWTTTAAWKGPYPMGPLGIRWARLSMHRDSPLRK